MGRIWPDEQPELSDGVVRLRSWRPDDADEVFRACQDELIQHFTQVPVPYQREHAERFVAGGPEQWAAGTGAQFAVVDASSGELLGCMGLMEPDEERRQIGAGYWMAPWGRGRGAMTRALRLATTWALDEGGFERVVLEAERVNLASTAVALGAGFVEIGEPDDVWELKGTVRNFAHYAITAQDVHRP